LPTGDNNSGFNLKKAEIAIDKFLKMQSYDSSLMKRLCLEAGPRPPGSSGIKMARKMLAEEYKNAGIGLIHTEAVTFATKDQITSELYVSKTDRSAGIHCDSLACINSASGNVTAKLFYGNNLSIDDLYSLGKQAKAAVLLVNATEVTGGKLQPMQKKVGLAQAAGAAAIIFIGQHPTLPALYFINKSHIPVLSISAGDGKKLIKRCQNRDVSVSMQVKGRSRTVKCSNWIAEMGPASAASDIIVACAHLDHFSISPGAMDDLSGVVTLTMAARAIAPFSSFFRRRMRLILFTGEEFGYVGSKQYVREHAEELDRIKLVLSLDCLFKSTAEGLAVMWAPKMKNYLAKAVSPLRPKVKVRNHFCMSSDYLPFMLAGVPTARPADWNNTFPGWVHTRSDTHDKIPDSWLKSNARLCAHVLLKCLTDPNKLPSRRQGQKEIEKLIEKEEAHDSLRWQVALP
jgi:hypothetical protein